MESVYIKGLHIVAYHGVLPQERRVGNEFVVDVRLDLSDASAAMATDALDSTVNYATVVDIIKQQMAVPSMLLEHVAARIREAICRSFPGMICSGEVMVSKVAPPIAAQIDAVAFSTSW